MNPRDTKACFLDHMGLYAMDEHRLADLVGGIQAGQVEARDRSEEDPELEIRDGVAVIALEGSLMKKRSKFGGTSTLDARTLVREAVDRDDVDSIMVKVNSPGGLVAGVDELHREIARADKAKPVYAHIEDLGASAGFWAICGARRITANRAAEVGSVGVLQVVEDTSEMAKREGVRVIPLRSGEFKGGPIPGTKLSKAQLANMQERVDTAAAMFFEAVQTGRDITDDAMAEIKKGGVYFAQDAQKMGLIDAVDDFESVLAKCGKKNDRRRQPVAHQMAAETGDSGLTAKLAEKNENSLDGDTAKVAQSAVLAGSDEMTELEKLQAKLDAEKKKNAELSAQLESAPEPEPAKPQASTSMSAAEREALIDDQVKAEIASRSLAHAKADAAGKLHAEFKGTGLTETMAKAFFASCKSAEEVEAEAFLKKKTLEGIAGANKPVAAEIKDFHAKAGDFDKIVAEEKKKTPNDLTGAMRRAKLREPNGYRAYMARNNGGHDVVGLKQGRISA